VEATLAFTLLAIFAATWFNNRRFDETKNRLNELSAKLNAKFDAFRDAILADIRVNSESMRAQIKNSSSLLEQL